MVLRIDRVVGLGGQRCKFPIISDPAPCYLQDPSESRLARMISNEGQNLLPGSRAGSRAKCVESDDW